MRVLIVDDEPLVRWSLSVGLRLAGFDTVTASSGDEALALARQMPRPQVILLDSRLYAADTGSLIDDLRTATPGCRLVLLTTASLDMARPPYENVTLLRKPFDLVEVVRLVDAADGPAHTLAS